MLSSAALHAANLAATKKSSGGGASFIIVIALLGLVFYFLILRPQRARQRLAQQTRSSLEPGAQVVTTGGLHATVTAVDEDEGVVSLEVAPGVVSRYSRAAIARVIEPDLYESTDQPTVQDQPPVVSDPPPSSATEETTTIETPPEGTPTS